MLVWETVAQWFGKPLRWPNFLRRYDPDQVLRVGAFASQPLLGTPMSKS